ncbi:GAF domain-containing protein [Pontixanthobacter luteolus]|uniref:GAF domain-containing protein n=1 Tax=Pontixanthobacter luteolus TaxID=295089 RepID=UPI002302B4CA|nr:GAF domain-containing protein [Pontixanthobacter luteolus]
MPNQKENAEALISPIERQFRDAIRSQNRLVNFLAILGVPTGLAIWLGAIDADKVGAVWFWITIIVLFALQVTLYSVSNKHAETVPVLHLANAELQATQDRLNDYIADNEALSDWLITANQLGAYWATYQALIATTCPDDDQKIGDSCRIALTPMMEAADVLFGFEFADSWSVAVYRFNETTKRLEPVWWNRSDDHPSSGTPREWRSGDGHVGSAFMQNRVLFTNDIVHDETAILLKPSASNSKEYDDEVYRSFISAPIMLDLEPTPQQFGVLVLTSNQSGRFNEQNKSIVGHASQVLAHLFDWRSRLQPSPK